MLRLLDCFSGIGGFSLAASWVGGFQTVGFVEIDPYCQRILRKHWPEVPVHDDIRGYSAEPGSVDVITAGFPCQDLSSAGKQEGLSGERSGLFYEVIRLARELRPQFIVFENVANLVSHSGGQRSKKCSSKLPVQGLMRNGQLYQQRMWEPAICESECGSLPTPTTRDHKDSGPNVNWEHVAEKSRLPGVVVIACQATGVATYLNPSFVEEMMGFPIGWTG